MLLFLCIMSTSEKNLKQLILWRKRKGREKPNLKKNYEIKTNTDLRKKKKFPGSQDKEENLRVYGKKANLFL